MPLTDDQKFKYSWMIVGVLAPPGLALGYYLMQDFWWAVGFAFICCICIAGACGFVMENWDRMQRWFH